MTFPRIYPPLRDAHRSAGEASANLTQGREGTNSVWSDKRGGTAVMLAMLAVPLIGFAALAIDVSAWEANKGAMQGAADQAALAAGRVLSAGFDAARSEAQGITAAHGFVHNVGDVSVVVRPPATGSHVGTANAVEVVITQFQKGHLSNVLLDAPPTATVRAVAVPDQGKTCILALAPTGNGITSSGSGVIDAGTCNIYVNSNSQCDITLSGGLKIKGLDVFLGEPGLPPCLSRPMGSVSATRNLKLNAPPAIDPYEKRVIPIPTSSCTPVNTSDAVIDLKPGTYCGIVLGVKKTINFANGIYIFNNSSIISSNELILNSTNASLIFTGTNPGGITSSGSLTLNFSPMTIGSTAGMAVWIDKRGSAGIRSSGILNLNVTGAVYMPGSDMIWSGNVNSPCTQLIARRIIFSGTANFRHECSNLGVDNVVTGSYSLRE